MGSADVANGGGGSGGQLQSLDTRRSKGHAEAGHALEAQQFEEAVRLLSHAGQRECIALSSAVTKWPAASVGTWNL